MFTRKPVEKTGLEKAIDDVHRQMETVEADSKEYSEMADNLTKLYKLREHDARPRVSPDTLAIVAGNLLGVIMIVGHERAHIITSKAMTFVTKLK